ncbi:MAG: helix-turn-helix domain-containing protein [Egibacteraceae bacterium]
MANPIPIDGPVLRDLRVLRALTQQQLGDEAGLDSRQICRYECGKKGPPPDHLKWIIAALGRIPVSPEQRALIKTPALDARLAELAKIGHDMDRRQLAKLAAAGTGGLILAPIPIDLGEMTPHQTTQELIGRWETTAPSESLAAARELLNRQQWTLRTAAFVGSERRELLIDAVDVAILAGWSASFVQLPAEAAAWFAHAENMANEAGLESVHGEVLASKATLHRPVIGDGDVRKGLEFAQAAAPLVGANGPLAKFVANLEAEMHGALPDGEDDCLRAIQRALDLPDHGGRDGFYSVRGIFADLPSAQHGWAGGRYAQLGRADEALEHLMAAQAEIPAVQERSRVIHHAQMTHAYAVAGDPEPTCDHAQLALDGSRATGYDLGPGRVLFARSQLEGCEGLECVRELDERLATL